MPTLIYRVVVYRDWAMLVVLSLYVYLSSFSLSCCTFFAIVISFFQYIPRIFISLESCTFVLFKQIPFCYFSCSLICLASPYLFIIWPFLSVSSRLFINLYIIIKSPFSSIYFSVVSCISFSLCTIHTYS